MNIPQKLHGLVQEPALLLAMSSHDGVIWKIADNTASEITRVHTDNPVYSDREGHFKTAAGGQVIGSGAVYEDTRQETLHEHVVAMEEKIKPLLLKHSWREAWLFMPSAMISEADKRLYRLFNHNIPRFFLIRRNVTDEEPLDLLARISEHKEESRNEKATQPVTAQARKLMHTTDELPDR